MKRALAIGIAVALASLMSSRTVWASIITFDYVQATASVPGLQMSGSITVNGTLADLPTLNCTVPTPPSLPIGCPVGNDYFGNLLAFSLETPSGIPGDLSRFVNSQPPPPAFPYPPLFWSIGPGPNISFNDQMQDYEIIGGNISFNSDHPTAPPDCQFTGKCFTTGAWEPVPEPASLLLLGTGMVLVVGTIRRRRLSAPLG